MNWADKRPVLHGSIEAHGYKLWDSRAHAEGNAEDDWWRAERDLIEERFKGKARSQAA